MSEMCCTQLAEIHDAKKTRQKFAIWEQSKQEGQHPLTGQRAPPISGGT